MVSARPGFSLVETAVAAALLSLAVMSVAAGGSAALRIIAAAEREQGALIAGTAVLDSLAQRPVVGSGRIARPPFAIDWNATDSASMTRIRITIRTFRTPHDSILGLSVLAGRPLVHRF